MEWLPGYFKPLTQIISKLKEKDIFLIFNQICNIIEEKTLNKEDTIETEKRDNKLKVFFKVMFFDYIKLIKS